MYDIYCHICTVICTHVCLSSQDVFHRVSPSKEIVVDVSDCWYVLQVRTLARTDEARGLLWLMEEEAVHPGGSEETMLERLFSYYGSSQAENKGEYCTCVHYRAPARPQEVKLYVE